MEAEKDRYKQQAAERAVEFVKSGMVLGLGYGTTSAFAIRRVGELIRAGQLSHITAILCSPRSETLAKQGGITLTNLEDHPVIDLTIDGADEVDPQLNLIKGGGGALLREKIVAQATRREIIIVDDSKLSPALGTHWPVPVEVSPFGWNTQAAYLEALGAQVILRKTSDRPYLTDQGNYILDCRFGPMDDLPGLAAKLAQRAGIVEHGLFLGMTQDVIVAGRDGVRELHPLSAV